MPAHLRALIVIATCGTVGSHAYSATGSAFACGTLDLSSKLTRHCFPPKADRHAVCCVDIQLPEVAQSVQSGLGQNASGYHNILESRIRSSSRPESLSWCTCSVDVCETQLGGTVSWILQPDGSTLSSLGSPHPAQSPNLLQLPIAASAMDVDRAESGGKLDPFSGGLDAMIADKENEVMRLMQSKREESDSTEEVDLAEKLRPLTKEQMEELIASLVAKYDATTGLGDDVLSLAKKPVDIAAIAHEIASLASARASLRDYANTLLPHADQALFYAQAGDTANCFRMAEALTRNLMDALPKRDPNSDLADLWERLEGAWEEGLRQSKRKQREGPKTLLRQAQAALTDGHGPIFSDALRLIDRLDKAEKKTRKDRSKDGEGRLKDEFFKKHGVSKKEKRKGKATAVKRQKEIK